MAGSSKNKSADKTPGNSQSPSPDDGLEIFEIEQILDHFPEATTVSIRRLGANGRRWVFCGSLPSDLCRMDEIQMRWPEGGRFSIWIHGSQGTILRKIDDIEIDPLPADQRKNLPVEPQVAPAPAAAAIATPMADQMMRLMSEQLAASQMLVIKAIEQLGNRETLPAVQQPAGSMLEMVNAMLKMRELVPTAPPVSFPEKMMERMWDMAMRPPEREEASDGSWASEARKFLTQMAIEFKPALMGHLTPAATSPGGQRPVPGPPVPAREPVAMESVPDADGEGEAAVVDEQWIKGLNLIFDYYSQGRTPEQVSMVVQVYANMNPEFKRDLQTLLQGTVDSIVVDDQRLNDPHYRAWFDRMWEDLRVQFLGSAGQPAGAGGNIRDAG